MRIKTVDTGTVGSSLHRSIGRVGLIAAAFSVTSCSTQEVDSPTPGESEEEVGIVQQELGEAACGTVSGLAQPHGAIDSSFSTSTDNELASEYIHYDISSSCPYQFIGEYTNLPAFNANYNLAGSASVQGANAYDYAFDSITNELDCERTRIYVGVYVWDSNTTNPSATYTYHGKGNWVGGEFGGCHTTLIDKNSSVFTDTGYFVVPTGKYKIRIAGRAQYCSGSDGCDAALNTNLRVETHLSRVPAS